MAEAFGEAVPIPIASALASTNNRLAFVSPSTLKSTSAPASLNTTAPEVFSVVKAPVLAVVAPIGVSLIEPARKSPAIFAAS